MEIFKKYGELIEKRWLAADYDEGVFPDLAAEVFHESDICESATIWELVEWAIAQTELPIQKDLHGNFGDPPVTLFNAPRFHLDVYFWLEGTTSIHQHAFCGAFQVFHGSSIHSQYEFDSQTKINFFAEAGELSLTSCELLEVGAVQKILPGDEYIHSLFHLDQPSATIVARTSYGRLTAPQFSYDKPGLATDPFHEESGATKKAQLLGAAVRANNPKADEYIENYLRNSDFFGSFQLLRSLRALLRRKTIKDVFGISESGNRFDRLVKLVEELHPQLGDMPSKVFEEYQRAEHIVALRNIISEKDHRFFLALLLNVEGLQNVLALIRARFNDSDPLEKLLDWVAELGNTRVVDNAFPNGLGIEGFSGFDTAVLEEMLRGKSENQIVEVLLQGSEDNGEAKGRIKTSLNRIKGSLIFDSLLK